MCCATSSFLCCLFIFFLQFNQLNANPPSITSATSYVKSNVSVLGDKFSMGLYDLEFDQDLYIPSGIGYCANVTCPPPPACPPCDYSIPKTCNGSGFGTPCVCPVVDCSQSASVPVLELDGPPLTMTITPNSPYTFLFHAVVPNNSCSSILIKWSNTNGAITSLSAYRIVDTLRVVPSILGYPSQVSLVRNSFLICPNGNLMGYSSLFSVLDLYSGVYPLDGYQITFTAETFTLPSPHDSSCSVPPGYQGSHECLPSGVETMIPATGDVQRFVIKPDKQCGVMQFASSQFNLLISTNPWVSPQNSSGAFKTATYVQDADYIFSGEPGVFYYCLDVGEYLFVWIDLRENVRFFIDTSEEWIQNIPLSSISPIDFPRYTLGAVTVECPSKNFTAMKYTPSYIETFDSGSANLRVLYPSEESNPFSSYTFYDNYEWRVSNNPSLSGTFVSKKLSIALTLSQNLVKRLQPVFPIYFPHDYLYLSTSEFYSCKVKLNGLIRNSNNEPIISTISNFQDKPQICNGKNFSIVKQQIQDLITESRNLTRDISTNYLDRLLYLRFTADVLSTSDAFYFCEEKVADLVQLRSGVSMVEADYCLANFGSANFSSDPCCTSPDNKYLTCKSENRAYESYSVAAFSDSIETSCSAPVCARDAIQRYVNEGERIKQSCSPPPQVAAWKKNRERFYWQCFTEIFGYDSTKPTPCRHDDDCPPVGGLPGVCNSLHKNCIGNVTALEEQFLQCIMDNASPFVFSAISLAIQVDKSDPDVFGQWWKNLQITALCSAAKHDVPAGYDSSIWGHSTVFPSCAYCSAVALEVGFSPGPGSTLWPWDCFGASLPCVTGEAPLPGIAYCFGSFTCNYDKDLNPFDPSGACSKRGQFCGFSENLRDATDLTSFNIPPASCNSTILCILANGTQIITSSQQECESIKSCDICPGCNEQECSVAGQCTDATDPIYSIWSGKIFGNATEGCLMQLSYESPFITTSDICVYPLRSTVLGCMIFPPLVTPESCVDPNNLFGFSNVYIKKGNSTWITRSKNQQECEEPKACRNVPRPTTQKSFYSDITVCSVVEECQGDFGNLWKWETANWRGGQARFPELMEYGPYPTYQFGATESLDFARIFNLIQFAANQELSLEVGSSLFCEHNLKTVILDQLVCSCSDQEPESSCFTKLTNQSTETKLAVACGGRDSSFSSPPLSVDLQEDSVAQNLCYSVAISNLPLSAYAPPPSSLLTLLLIQSRFDYSYSIQNPNGQTYGKLLTDGFSLSVQSENQTLKNAGICVTRSRASDPRLPLYDIAILMDGKFLPQNQTVLSVDNTLCTNLTTIANGQAYFFIQKTAGDYLNPPRLDFTRGEIAYISVILALYVIGLIVVTFLLLRHIIINFILDRMLFVIIVMETFFLCRTILFSLALSNTQSVQQQPAVGYLLVEFPILLFFCFVSFFVITWGLILWSKKDLALSQKKFVSLLNITVILFNTIIFGLFILMIILFQTIVDPPYYICASTEVVFDSDRAYALSLSYRCIFSTVAIALGLALLFVGGWMLRMTSDEELGIPVRTIVQVFIATVVGTFGLMAQAIYYLIVVAVGNKQSIYLTLSILLVDEVIPALIFTSLTITTNPNSKGLRGFVSKLTTKTKSSSSKSSSKSVSIPA